MQELVWRVKEALREPWNKLTGRPKSLASGLQQRYPRLSRRGVDGWQMDGAVAHRHRAPGSPGAGRAGGRRDG